MINSRQGQISIAVVFFAALAVVLLTGFVFVSNSMLRLSVRALNRNQAFTIAEAGIEYYRWHLAHASADFKDGGTGAGPYIHPYYDKNGTHIGEFDLAITPPASGSTVVTIRSTGKVDADPTITKIIQVKLAIPSFAKYAVAENSDVRFGAGTQVFGEIFSNGGIHFDGVAHNLVASAQGSYTDPDHSGSPEFGVHTHSSPTDPLPPAAIPSRPDIFMAGRSLSVPALDFTKITQDLANLKSTAQSGGYYATSSGAFGYDLLLSPTGSFTVYKVTALTTPGGSCFNSAAQSGWGTWSIQTESVYATGTVPANGSMFFEDNLWVRGSISNERVTVSSGKFPDNPSTRTSITVNSNLTYTNYNGADSIGLIAQKDINVGLVASDTLRIDAAMIAQNGRIGRYYYPSGCAPYNVRSTLTSYGMIGSNGRYGFAYTDSTGYQTRNLVYDSNLLYGPPPSFPLTTDQYVQLSWDEVQ